MAPFIIDEPQIDERKNSQDQASKESNAEATKIRKSRNESWTAELSFLKTVLAGLYLWGTILLTSIFFGFIYGVIESIFNSKSVVFLCVAVFGIITGLHAIGWIAKRLVYKHKVGFLDASHIKTGWQIVWRGILFYILTGFIAAFVISVIVGLGGHSINEYAVPMALFGILLGLYTQGWAVENVGMKFYAFNRAPLQGNSTQSNNPSEREAGDLEAKDPERLHNSTQVPDTKTKDSPVQRKISVNIRLAWIIPVIVCLLLLAAWPFRWEKGPTQSFSGAKIVHLKDRWVEQRWIALYGNFDDGFYSGEARPHFSKNEIMSRAKKVLLEPEGLKKKALIETQLQDAKKKKAELTNGHNQYIELKKLLEARFALQHPKPRPVPTYRTYNSAYEEALAEMEAWGDELAEENEWLAARNKYVKSKIPAGLYGQYWAWQDQGELISKLNKDLKSLQAWAKKEAEKKLSNEAYRNRNLATNIWIISTAITTLSFIPIFLWGRKNRFEAKS